MALGALTLIVWTGAAVRLSGSGLGCPTWPKCYGSYYPPLNSHAVIEFSNRLITVPVVIAAGLAWVGALRRRPYRRDLVWLAGVLPLGVIGQAVLGGFTVKGALDYGWVMGHFALSMLILVAAVLLVFRASRERESVAEASRADRALVRSLRGLVALGALAIFAGTAATASGPHAGGSPGQKINRLSLDGHGTMDFVIHRHAEIALAVQPRGRRRLVARPPSRAPAPAVQRPLTVLCVLLAAAGRRRARPVRDPPADRARVGPRRARLLRLGGGDLVGRGRRRAAAAQALRGRPRSPGAAPGARRAAAVPRKLGHSRRPLRPRIAGAASWRAASLHRSNDKREGSRMTKNDLADLVAERADLSGSQARQVVETTIDAVSDELARGGEVSLAGFGKFSVSQRAAREGRNPATGETIKIAASKAAKFSAASALKKRLNP